MKQLSVLIITSLFLSSCANIAKGIFFPNQCTKCEVYNTSTQKVLETFEDCGSLNVGLEEDAKVAAYEIMKKGNCQIRVRCNSWKKETE